MISYKKNKHEYAEISVAKSSKSNNSTVSFLWQIARKFCYSVVTRRLERAIKEQLFNC